MKVNQQPMREKILGLIKKNPELADDDKRLIATVWWTEGWRDKNLYENLLKVSSPETIRRTRAKLAQEGLIKPSKAVEAARKEEEKHIKDMLKYGRLS